ncbi:MAG: hypothetical protein KatS3mg009_0036 [Acidimicrobiia bacterium]|nr:MAG: hypothetical protein KatS3mg009_0036 [Acidimicrobiia bacterium]
MNSGLVVLLVLGWVLAAVASSWAFARHRAERMPRRGVDAPGRALPAAVAELLNETSERVASARAMQHWFVAALDETDEAIVVVDRIGREVLRNRSAQRFTGARHAHALAEEAMHDLIERALLGELAERELQLYGPPAQVLALRAVPLRQGVETVGAAAFVRDVTESRRIESVRRDFVANVSHELKTPIGALGLLAETMISSEDPAVVRSLAERVLREAERLSRIVDDLLDLSQIESQEAPTRVPVPARVLVNEAVDHVQAAADQAGVPILVNGVPPDVEIPCEPRQVRSALVNLLDNAIKYSGPAEPVEVSARVDGDRVAFVVRDHGIGIPSRDLERIFERFYRVDRARSRDTGGTGLGLSIVRHVAQAHGGEVSVESTEGEGSTFVLSLPHAQRGPRALSEAS